MTSRARLAMGVTAAIASLMAASVRVFRLDFEGMYIDWQLTEDDLGLRSNALPGRNDQNWTG